MRNKRLIALFCFWAWFTPALARALPAIVDPVFHLTLPAAIYTHGFEEFPAAQLKSCGVVVRADASYRYWVLAETSNGNMDYVMLDGLVKPSSGAPWQADMQGVFLRRSAAGCSLIDPLDQVFAYYQSYETDSPAIGGAVFVALARDAVRRFSAAYGSSARFKAALVAQKRLPSLSILKNALAR
ncbi:hypothetical protein [Acidocella facilis]|uniref:hypothetical protein n=1 Tax=Acidocella facilis TaxID=525 RepID=UPI0012DCAD17|nr:hypothetical protein [Acidocella facilis]